MTGVILLVKYQKGCISKANLVIIPLQKFPEIRAITHSFPSGLDSKESTCNARDPGLIPGSGIPGEGNGYPLQYSCPVFLPGESHVQRSLAGYSPRSLKELDATE